MCAARIPVRIILAYWWEARDMHRTLIGDFYMDEFIQFMPVLGSYIQLSNDRLIKVSNIKQKVTSHLLYITDHVYIKTYRKEQAEKELSYISQKLIEEGWSKV